MRDFLTLGPVPAEEECQQVGTENYDPQKAFDECVRYKKLIREKFGDEPRGADLHIKSFPHDFGSYYEVVCYYDDNYEEAIDYAFACENNSPVTWDDKEKIDWRNK